MRILGLDVGDKTVGVAVSDALGLTAQGVEVIRRTEPQRDIERLRELVAQYEVTAVVVGLPKNMNGTLGPRAEICRQFGEELAACLPDGISMVYWDERLSTVAAERMLIAADVSRAKRKKVIDKMAAVFILQGYLDSRPRE